MKIVNIEEFYKLPSGTLFSDYEPVIFNGLRIKKDTITDLKDNPIDFFYTDLIGNVYSKSSLEFYEILDNSLEKKTSFSLNFDSVERYGLYDDGLFAIYENEDLLGLIDKLSLLKK